MAPLYDRTRAREGSLAEKQTGAKAPGEQKQAMLKGMHEPPRPPWHAVRKETLIMIKLSRPGPATGDEA
jgi:hypothetical protein